MDLPGFASQQLKSKYNLKSEQELFYDLSANFFDLTDFFILASDDETWCESYPLFIKNSLEKLTSVVFWEDPPLNWIEKIIGAIRSHASLLTRFLPLDIEIKGKDFQMSVNSLVIMASSFSLKERVQKELKAQKRFFLDLTELDKNTWQDFYEWMQTGKIESLWKKEKAELFQLSHLAKQFNLEPLSFLAEEILARYIDQHSALDLLISAHLKKMPVLQHACEQFLTDKNFGVAFSKVKTNEVAFEFLNFKDEAKELFRKLAPYISHLIVSKNLTQDPFFLKALKQLPHLIGLDVHDSENFTESLYEAPKTVVKLDLSACSWLNQENFKNIVKRMPQLTDLKLRGNTHLNYTFWQELFELKQLKQLDISQCHQLKEGDFSILLYSIGNITDFYAEECTNLKEEAFFEIPNALPHLFSLHLSKSSITDSAAINLVMKCPFLTVFELARCPQISEKGVLEVIKIGKKLKKLKIKGLHLSESTYQKILALNPYLTIDES